MPRSLLTSALLAALLASTPAVARDDAGGSRLPEAVRHIERETGGRVLKAQPMMRGGREVPRVKVLMPDGRVRVIRQDPREASPPAGADRPAAARLPEALARDPRSAANRVVPARTGERALPPRPNVEARDRAYRRDDDGRGANRD